MKSARIVILVLTGLVFTGCYTQLQMSKSAGKKGGAATQEYQERSRYLSGYQYIGYSSFWGNYYYSPMSSYFGWYSWYRYPNAYNYYRFHNTSGYFFASGGQEQTNSNYGPRVIGANRVGDNTGSVERNRGDEDNNSSRVRSRATADGDDTKTSRSRSSAERSDESNLRLMNQIRLARGLESVREDLSASELPRVELDTWNVDKEIERKFGKDLSAYIKTNRSDFYHRLKGYFKRENNRVRSSDVYRGSDFKSSPRSTSASVRSRSTVTRSSSGDSRSRSSSSSSRSRNNSGDGSSGSERSRGNN